jgi:hypothetical protein
MFKGFTNTNLSETSKIYPYNCQGIFDEFS